MKRSALKAGMKVAFCPGYPSREYLRPGSRFLEPATVVSPDPVPRPTYSWNARNATVNDGVEVVDAHGATLIVTIERVVCPWDQHERVVEAVQRAEAAARNTREARATNARIRRRAHRELARRHEAEYAEIVESFRVMTALEH